MSFDAGKFRNTDGSTDFDLGPTVPKRFETYGIPSVSVQHGYVIPNYAPLEPYIDRIWGLPDIGKVKCMGED